MNDLRSVGFLVSKVWQGDVLMTIMVHGSPFA